MKKYLSLSLILFLFLGMLSPIGAYSQEDSSLRLFSDTENSVSEQVLEKPAEIRQAYYRNYIYLEIILSDVPEERPNSRLLKVVRYIDGELDEEFEWHGDVFWWNEKTRVLVIKLDRPAKDVKYEVKVIGEQDIEIEDVTEYNFTHLFISFTKKPEISPTASTVKITRTIDGKKDTEFVWDGKDYTWDEKSNTLGVYYLPYDEDKEIIYNVSYGDSEPITVDTKLPVMIAGFLEWINGTIVLTFDGNFKEELTPSDFTVVRSVNDGELEEVEILELSYIDDYVTFIRIPPDRATDVEQSISYAVIFRRTQIIPFKPFIIEDNSSVGIEKVYHKMYTDLNIVLSVPKVHVSATSVDIVRYINGKLDRKFEWTGGMYNWDRENKTLTIKQIESVEGAQYKVIYEEDPAIIVEDVTKTDYLVFDIILTSIPSEDPTASSVNITRTINGQPDNEFVWSGGDSSWYTNERRLRLYDIPLPEPTDVEQVVEYTVSYNNSTIELEPIVVSAKSDIVDDIQEFEEVIPEDKKEPYEIEVENPYNATMYVTLPSPLINRLRINKENLVINSDNIQLNVPPDGLVDEVIPQKGRIEFGSWELTEGEINDLEEITKNTGKVAKALELSIQIINGREIRNITKFNNIIIKVNVEDAGDKDKLGVYYINEEANKLEFVGGKIKDGMLIFKINHYGKYAVIESNKTFTDMTNHWAKDYVESMAAKNVIGGYDDGLFRPQGNVTRAEFAKMIVKALELDLIEYSGEFSDITGEEWYADYIATAKAAGIISGYTDGTFKPNKNITREEMAKMISVAIKDIKMTDEEIEEVLSVFSDGSSMSNWAKKHVAKVYKIQLMNGVKPNQFVPGGITTRAEAATAIYRLYNR